MKMIKRLILLIFYTLAIFNSYAQPVKLDQLKENTFVICLDDNYSASELSWSKYPDSWKNPVKLDCQNNPDTLELVSMHPFIKSNINSKPYFCSQRLISLQGAINFRDLGGYSTNVGKQVKWGKIYRSADISKLTDKDLKTLTELNIKFECDLRGEKEYEAAPDKLPDGIERIALPAGSENVSPGMSGFIKYMKSEATADSMIMAMYSKTDHFQKKYKPMFDRLLSLGTDEALMFHCTAGKDRTGIGAALILYALGVNENTIYDDYEATNIYRESSNKQYIKALTAYGISEKAAQKLMAADRKYLKATFDSLKKQYGSVEFFLQSEMGLTMNNLKILREKYLY